MGETVVQATAVVLVLVAAIAGMTYSCSALNTRYYDVVTECVKGGGTYVPQGQSSYTGTCVRGQQ